MTSHTMGERIKMARKAKGLTQKQLGEIIGAAHTSISNWENDQNYPDMDTITRLLETLDISANHLLGNDLEISASADKDAVSIFSYPDILPIGKQRLPVLGSVSCGEPQYAEEELEFYIQNTTHINADFILRARGDSMIGARIYDGDLVFVRKQPDVDDGQIAVVLIDDETLLKRVYKLRDGRRELRAENPKYRPIMVGGRDETRTIQILGRAVALQTDVI